MKRLTHKRATLRHFKETLASLLYVFNYNLTHYVTNQKCTACLLCGSCRSARVGNRAEKYEYYP